MGESKVTVAKANWETSEPSWKLSSAPESMRADSGTDRLCHKRVASSWYLEGEPLTIWLSSTYTTVESSLLTGAEVRQSGNGQAYQLSRSRSILSTRITRAVRSSSLSGSLSDTSLFNMARSYCYEAASWGTRPWTQTQRQGFSNQKLTKIRLEQQIGAEGVQGGRVHGRGCLQRVEEQAGERGSRTGGQRTE